VEDPFRLLLSVTTDLPTVRYAAEIVRWEDKRDLLGPLQQMRKATLNRIIASLQPNEGGLYDLARGEDESLNLLHVWRLRALKTPFRVGRLVKTSDGEPVSETRTSAGGWSYVRYDAELEKLLA
jgi:hypothetical protein